MSKTTKIFVALMLITLSACIVDPYDAGPYPPPGYYGNYYGYTPGYPWGGVGVDFRNGYGHGGYGYRGGHRGGGGGGGGRR